jgi:hypothetical protein
MANEKELASALHAIAAAMSVQAETNAVLAAQMAELTGTIRGQQRLVEKSIKPTIDRARAQAAAAMQHAREALDASGS